MKITVLTLFPKMIEGFFAESIIKRAIDKALVKIEIINIRDWAEDKYKTVDDRPYGGGAGMVLKIEPIHKALSSIFRIPNSQFPISKQVPKSKIVLTSARGKTFNQNKAQEYSKLQNLIIIAGHYEGVDERVLDYIDEEISLGDFIMTGGEIAAAAIADSVVRLLPGVLKKETATEQESYSYYSIKHLIEYLGENDILGNLKKNGVEKVRLLEYPQYTRPEEFQGKKVPEVLLNGNHREIETWRLKKAFAETLAKRPDLLI